MLAQTSLVTLALIGLASGALFEELQRPLLTAQASKMAAAGKRARASPVEGFIEQKLDHFDQLNTETWSQKYWERKEFDQPMTVFVMLSNEGGQSYWLETGLMVESHQQFQANMYLLEPRFYGDQRPTADLTVESLKYLSTEQILADIAFFLEKVRADNVDAQVVLFGMSYGGALATWARMKYPHLVDGAVVSSAAVSSLVDFPQYTRLVRNVLNLTDEQCASDIQEATDEMTRILDTPTGSEEITTMFNLCSPLDTSDKMDMAMFFTTFANAFGVTIKYAQSLSDIEAPCNVVTDEEFGATPLERYATLSRQFFSCGADCFMYSYTDFVLVAMLNTTWGGPGSFGARPWFYQQCSEFGRFRTSNETDHPFGHYFGLDVFVQACADIFDSRFDMETIEAGVDQTNLVYGGMTPQVTNVVFTHGSLDPERPLQVKHDLSPQATAIHIPGATHGWDLKPTKPEDTLELTEAREKVKRTISSWLV